MESLRENKKYLKFLATPLVFCLILTLNISEDINENFDITFKNIDPAVNY